MTGYKHSLWKILSAVAALALLLPQLALGEFGVCPPYSKTFGPDDPPEAILAFVDELNARPGGGTLILEPGVYTGLNEDVTISGVVCIRRAAAAEDAAYARVGGYSAVWTVQLGGLLTMAQLDVLSEVVVDNGATLFVDRALLSGAHDAYQNDGRPSLQIGMGGFARIAGSTVGGVENLGALVVSDGVIDGGFPYYEDEGGEYGVERGRPSLLNEGYAMLDQVSVRGALPAFKGPGDPSGIDNTGVISIVGSTVTDNGGCDWYTNGCAGVGVRNSGFMELIRSIVANNYYQECVGTALDLGYNVFETGGGCVVTESTSIEADPLIGEDQELMTGSPAIDRAPLDLCRPTDRLGRARTDGNSDGTVACDSGALEYGYASVEVVVRTTPYWRTVGRIDLSRETAMFVAVMSGGPIDPTSILFDSIAVGDFPRSAMRGVSYTDKNGDGLADFTFWYRLDKDLELECRYYDEPFSAQTDDGQQVTGRLRFEAMGCTD